MVYTPTGGGRHPLSTLPPLFHEIVVSQARPATRARPTRDAYLISLTERDTLDFARIHLLNALDAELKAAQDRLARQETNLASYTEQRAFEQDDALPSVQPRLWPRKPLLEELAIG